MLADSEAIDAAVIDLNLKDGRTGVALARRLYDQGIAVILCSSDALAPRELDDIKHIYVPKPMAAEALCDFIQKIAASRCSVAALENN